MKASLCEKYVDLETYEKMRIIIKEKYRNNLESAKILYNSCQELCNVLNNSKTEFKTNQELIIKIQEKMKIEQAIFEQEDIQLGQEIETINNDLTKEESLKNDEKEYDSLLKMELDNLEMEIKQCENSLSIKEYSLTEKEIHEEKKEEKIIEEFNIIDNEINVTTNNLEQIKTTHLSVINDLDISLKRIEEQ